LTFETHSRFMMLRPRMIYRVLARRPAFTLSLALGLGAILAVPAIVVLGSPGVAHASVTAGDVVFDRSSGNVLSNELMLRRASDSSVVDLGVVGSTPAVSPDGSRIAFINGSSYLSVMNSDGTGVTQIRQDDPAQHFVD